jgi:hypothetical protein
MAAIVAVPLQVPANAAGMTPPAAWMALEADVLA